ncbi:MAG: twin-arginine translocation signal domain-containing protein [Actinomycetota bacterium]
MDRRNALKKIAAGGATAAAATTIISRPAFANYDAPTLAASVESAVAGINGSASVCRVFYSVTEECPNSSVGIPSFSRDIFISDPGPKNVSATNDNEVRLRVETDGNQAFEPGDTFQVTFTLTGMCNYTGGPGQTGSLTSVWQVECETSSGPPTGPTFTFSQIS